MFQVSVSEKKDLIAKLIKLSKAGMSIKADLIESIQQPSNCKVIFLDKKIESIFKLFKD